MAYTYEQFESEARKAGALDKFDKQDLTIAQTNPEYGISMLQLMKNRNGAKTSEQRILADEAVRQLRQNYSGYVSGGRLPEYADEVIQQTDNYYAGQSAYRRQLAEAGGYGSHAYDEKLGDIYAHQNDLERERARSDALARASAATGGMPSSYALMLAQQAVNDSDAQLEETILGLRKNAYQQALQEAAQKNPATGGNKKPETSPQWTEEQRKENTKLVLDFIKKAPAKAVQAVTQAVGKASGLDKVVDNVVDAGKNVAAAIAKPFQDAYQKLTAPKPVQTSKTDALTKSIDGNLNIWRMQGLSQSQLQEKILGYLNNDGYVGDLTDGEWAWLAEYYNLV